MTLRHRTRLALRKAGIDVARFPQASPDYQAFRALTSVSPDVILDVGANDGGYARQCRDFGYVGEIISFEPGADAFTRLEARSQGDPRWAAHRLALGDGPGELTLHVTANAGASSSLLPMLPAHIEAEPSAFEASTELVPVQRLDEWVASNPSRWPTMALKIDTQGYERSVLEGAGSLLVSSVASVQLELSLVALYEGSWLWREAVDWLDSKGFDLVGLTPGFTDARTGRLLQFDGVFERRAIDDWRECSWRH